MFASAHKYENFKDVWKSPIQEGVQICKIHKFKDLHEAKHEAKMISRICVWGIYGHFASKRAPN